MVIDQSTKIWPAWSIRLNLYEFALMKGLIELGERFGLRPSQLPFEYDTSDCKTYIMGLPAIEYGDDKIGVAKRWKSMLEALGCCEDDAFLPFEDGDDTLDAIESAIEKSPRKRAR
jgi:hypothetical protein